MKVLVLLACVAAAAAMAVDEESTHDHPYECNGAGIFSDPADHCEGFHVCSYNWANKEMQHVRYIACPSGRLFNGIRCVDASQYTCPY